MDIMYVYNELKNNPEFKANYHPHTFIFGAKSAPGYFFAKKVIKLIKEIDNEVRSQNFGKSEADISNIINQRIEAEANEKIASNISGDKWYRFE